MSNYRSERPHYMTETRPLSTAPSPVPPPRLRSQLQTHFTLSDPPPPVHNFELLHKTYDNSMSTWLKISIIKL